MPRGRLLRRWPRRRRGHLCLAWSVCPLPERAWKPTCDRRIDCRVPRVPCHPLAPNLSRLLSSGAGDEMRRMRPGRTGENSKTKCDFTIPYVTITLRRACPPFLFRAWGVHSLHYLLGSFPPCCFSGRTLPGFPGSVTHLPHLFPNRGVTPNSRGTSRTPSIIRVHRHQLAAAPCVRLGYTRPSRAFICGSNRGVLGKGVPLHACDSFCPPPRAPAAAAELFFPGATGPGT